MWRSADGAPLRSIGRGEGSGPGQLRLPWGLALSPDGAELFVVEWFSHRVSVFEPRTDRHLRSACDAASGGTLWCYGREGSGDGKLSCTFGLALSCCGRELFVADGGNRRVVVVAVYDGSAVRSWAVAEEPDGVGLGPDGRLFVTSAQDIGRLCKFS